MTLSLKFSIVVWSDLGCCSRTVNSCGNVIKAAVNPRLFTIVYGKCCVTNAMYNTYFAYIACPGCYTTFENVIFHLRLSRCQVIKRRGDQISQHVTSKLFSSSASKNTKYLDQCLHRLYRERWKTSVFQRSIKYTVVCGSWCS